MKSTDNPGLLQLFVESLVAAARFPKFKGAVVAICLGLAIVLLGTFLSEDSSKMIAGILGMLISCAGFEQIGKLIQIAQEQVEDKTKVHSKGGKK